VKLTLSNRHPKKRVNLKDLERRLSRHSSVSNAARRRVEVVFTDDPTIRKLSGKYRGIRHATDVLSFCYGDEGIKQGFAFGEIIISLDTAAKQAAERKGTLRDELLLLIIHGLLHMAGMDDEDPDSWIAMRHAEFENLIKIV